MKNYVVYLSNEPTLDFLGRIENINTVQSFPISDPVKVDFDNYDFTNAHIKYFKNNLYIAVPVESLLLVYNVSRGYWEAPQTIPVRRLEIIGGDLYGHSSNYPETYKLLDGFNDNDGPIDAKAKFSYQTYGMRANKKDATEWFTEGYIGGNTVLQQTVNFDFGGNSGISEFDIDGADTNILFGLSTDGSTGKEPLGAEPLGGQAESDQLSKFRIIQKTSKTPFYEAQVIYETNEIDNQWEILAYGGDITKSSESNYNIKQ